MAYAPPDPTLLKASRFLEGALASAGRVIFPAVIDRQLITLAESQMGPDWSQDPEVQSWLKPAFQSVISDMVDAASPEWTREKLLAALFGLAPLNFHKIPLLLRDLYRTKTVGSAEAIRVLDVGAGAGLASLSALYFFELWANCLDIVDVMGEAKNVFVALTPLDGSDDALSLYQEVIYQYIPRVENRFGYDISAKLKVQIDEATNVREMLGEEQYDLILVSHMLSELRDMGLDRRAQVASDLAAHLAPGGAMLMVESSPGGMQAVNQLKSRMVTKGLNLYGPCAHLMGKPAGPICFTCGMSRKEEIAPPKVMQQFLRVVGPQTAVELYQKSSWTYGIFTPQDLRHHPAVQLEPSSKISTVSKSRKSGRANFSVQIAKRETEPFPFFKVCDQSAKIEECYLVFAPEIPQMRWEIGTVVTLKNVKVDFNKRPDGDKLKNTFWLVVDRETEISDPAQIARSVEPPWTEGA